MSSPLSDYFKGVGAKRLSQVEVISELSNQHELNGIADFKSIFGSEKIKFNTKFIYLSDDEEKSFLADGFLTWYDSRENHPSRSEYRLYYSKNEVLEAAKVNDFLLIGKTENDELIAVIAPQNSTSEKQLLWLFGLEIIDNKFVVKDLSEEKKDIGFAGRYILNLIGVEQKETAPDFLEELLLLFGHKFPSTKEFSAYSRSTVKNVSPIEEPDETLIAWLEREELLFKTLEKVIVKEQIIKGFGEDGSDVEEFIKLSLSIQNRRKSRAGFSFENNLAVLFTANNILYSHGAVTERNNRPDFLFPGAIQYHNDIFDIELLTMLGVKTSAKDRWRQVLSEASRVENKHLITLEPSISQNQIEEMKANCLNLVLPKSIHSTYHSNQKQHLMDVKEFINIVVGRQNKASLI